jgi:hypothetical protein
LHALFVGGGGYTFPRYMRAKYPDSTLDVIEIDPGVTEIAYEQLGLQRSSGIVTYNEDARQYMTRQPARPYDLIIGDAFNDFSVPYHLTTKEFNDLLRRWLAPGGLYLVNLIDGFRHDFVRAYVHTLQQTFRYVYLAPAASEWRDLSRMTYVVIAGDTALDVEALAALNAGGPTHLLPGFLLSSQDLAGLLAEGRAVLLTDQYAPVDQLLAPVVRNDSAPTPAAQPTPTPGVMR